MRLYTNSFGPGPRRVGLFLAMKGIDDVEFVQMPSYGGRSPEFLQKSPGGKIPLLELDYGDCLFESQAIIQFLEESYPDPPMLINDEDTRQKIDILCHLANEFFHYFYITAMHGSPVVSKFLVQDPNADALSRPLALARLKQISQIMGGSTFLAGDCPTIADIMLYTLIEYNRMRFGVFLPLHLTNLVEWYDHFQTLPGMYPNGWHDDDTFWDDEALAT